MERTLHQQYMSLAFLHYICHSFQPIFPEEKGKPEFSFASYFCFYIGCNTTKKYSFSHSLVSCQRFQYKSESELQFKGGQKQNIFFFCINFNKLCIRLTFTRSCGSAHTQLALSWQFSQKLMEYFNELPEMPQPIQNLFFFQNLINFTLIQKFVEISLRFLF